MLTIIINLKGTELYEKYLDCYHLFIFTVLFLWLHCSISWTSWAGS